MKSVSAITSSEMRELNILKCVMGYIPSVCVLGVSPFVSPTVNA